MIAIRTLLAAAAALGLAGSAHAESLYANNFDGLEVRGDGVLGGFGGVPTERAATGPWNPAGWSGEYAVSRAPGNPASPTSLSLTNLAPHTTISAHFVLGFLESWDSTDADPRFSPDILEILIDGVSVASLTYNNAIGTVKDTDGNPVLFEYVQANSNLNFSDTLVDYTLTFAHTGSNLNFQLRAGGGGWQGDADEGYGLDDVRFSYDGVRAPTPGGVPEPASWALMILGVGAAGSLLRRRRFLAAE